MSADGLRGSQTRTVGPTDAIAALRAGKAASESAAGNVHLWEPPRGSPATAMGRKPDILCQKRTSFQ